MTTAHGEKRFRFKMRVSIREQLGLLVLLCSLMGLMVLALATWFQNYHFITNIRLSGLSLTASLKAAQLASSLLLYQSQVESVSTRILIQSALQRYNNGTNTAFLLNATTYSDFQGALSNGNLLVQAAVFPAFNTTNDTSNAGLIKVTATLDSPIRLPYNNADGSSVNLGDDGSGYPPMLYPNITYGPNTTDGVGQAQYAKSNNRTLEPMEMLLLGPLIVNDSYALLSATVGIINNTSRSNLLGWLTVVVDAAMLIDILKSPEGLGNTGQSMIVGPSDLDNLYSQDPRTASTRAFQDSQSAFQFPLNISKGRHSDRSSLSDFDDPFVTSSYTAVVSAWKKDNNAANNAGAYISTTNEQGDQVSVGYAQISAPSADWVLLVEQAHGEVVAPINHLRDVVLICVFAVTGLLLVIIFPVAHYSIAPIRQLRNATLKTVEPYQSEDGQSEYSSHPDRATEDDGIDNEEAARKEGFFTFARFGRSKENKAVRRRRTFRIPSKVPERKHFVTDELTELTSTFNDMSDELAMQYERLEERVKLRTAELEKSKKAAEAANQSKTLFIANISHELKTPLNGILGLTTVCMNEDDMGRIRSTLNTIYKSGDLLLHLLTDLLTFSKNEIGSSVSIDENEFRVNDLATQLIPTFEKQAREGKIDLKVLFLGTNDAFGNSGEFAGEKLFGPSGTGRIRDMCLYGDKNRILQVLMNFVSNSLKFTPEHGSVTVRVKCAGLLEHDHFALRGSGATRKSSLASRTSKTSTGKKVRMSDASLAPTLRRADSDQEDVKDQSRSSSGEDAKLSINVAGGTTQIAKVAERRRSMSPPRLNTKDLTFDFEVEDTGPGIPPEQQKKIFEPFVQGDLGLSKKYGGTGLGLSICAQLAALMGGAISLDSTPGQGSKFTMRIPLRYVSQRTPSTTSSLHRSHSKASSLAGEPLTGTHHSHQSTVSLGAGEHEEPRKPLPEPRLADVPRIVGFTQPYVAKETSPKNAEVKLKEMRQAEQVAAKQGKKVRVLVAEDNPVNQEVVLRMLKLEDVYDVTIAKDGQEAFDKVQDSMKSGLRFDLVFMDVQMPNLDGIQSTRLIREAGFKSPIVALTAFAEKSNEDECMASGMDYFLAKPIRRPALKQVLKKYAPIPEENEAASPSDEPPTRGRPPGRDTDGSGDHQDTELSPKSTPGAEGKKIADRREDDISPMS